MAKRQAKVAGVSVDPHQCVRCGRLDMPSKLVPTMIRGVNQHVRCPAGDDGKMADEAEALAQRVLEKPRMTPKLREQISDFLTLMTARLRQSEEKQ